MCWASTRAAAAPGWGCILRRTSPDSISARACRGISRSPMVASWAAGCSVFICRRATAGSYSPAAVEYLKPGCLQLHGLAEHDIQRIARIVELHQRGVMGAEGVAVLDGGKDCLVSGQGQLMQVRAFVGVLECFAQRQ